MRFACVLHGQSINKSLRCDHTVSGVQCITHLSAAAQVHTQYLHLLMRSAAHLRRAALCHRTQCHRTRFYYMIRHILIFNRRGDRVSGSFVECDRVLQGARSPQGVYASALHTMSTM